VSGRHKLLRRGDDELWVDLASDPLELDPKPLGAVARDDAGGVDRLRAALAHPAVVSSRPFKTTPMQAASDEELRQLEDQMKLLGYL
jgi:hypothetical protein